MKLLTLSFLLFALLALSYAADTTNETVTEEPEIEETVPEGEDEVAVAEDESEGDEAAPEKDDFYSEEEESESDADTSEEEESDSDTLEPSHVVKRATSCPSGWTKYGSRCFLYVGATYTWAQAESYCVARGGNLASVRSSSEYNWLRTFIYSKARSYKLSWIGGSDAEQNGIWFWSDGSRFIFRDWCSSRPTRSSSLNCLSINYSSCRCGIDISCTSRIPFVCVRN